MAKKFKVVIVDDHPVVRRGIAETFSEEADFEVVGQGASSEEAVALARAKRPDLILLDVTMPGDGIEAAATIAKVMPSTAIAMLSIREDLKTVRNALRAGAHGYITKGVSASDLINSSRRILGGERYVSPELAARLITEDAKGSHHAPASHKQVRTSLTEREREIFALVGEGLSNQEIADRIGLTENTVKHYLTPLFQKLGVRNRTEAALLAREPGAG